MENLDKKILDEIHKCYKELNKRIEEHTAYLKVMEGYRNLDEPCEHKKAKTITRFEPIIETNLECAELECIECHSFVGLAYRRIKLFKVEKTTIKIIQPIEIKQYHIFKEKT